MFCIHLYFTCALFTCVIIASSSSPSSLYLFLPIDFISLRAFIILTFSPPRSLSARSFPPAAFPFSPPRSPVPVVLSPFSPSFFSPSPFSSRCFLLLFFLSSLVPLFPLSFHFPFCSSILLPIPPSFTFLFSPSPFCSPRSLFPFTFLLSPLAALLLPSLLDWFMRAVLPLCYVCGFLHLFCSLPSLLPLALCPPFLEFAPPLSTVS